MGDLGDPARLPNSHYFITVARGGACRTVSVRTRHLRAAACATLLLAAWTACSSAYLLFHDDLVGAMMAREAQVQYAYEDRIAVLRAEVDRQASAKLVGQTRLEATVDGLALRARTLEARADLVARMAARVGDARPTETAARPAPEAARPHPEPETAARPRDGQSAALSIRLSDLTASLERTDARQYDAVAAVGQQARRTAAAFRAAVAEAGLSPERFGDAPAGQGGPFVPIEGETRTSPFDRALASVRTDVAEAERFGRALPTVPLGSPLPGTPDVTSPFGPRLDPFLGRPALHTGLDLREEAGAAVRTTADGTVVSAGPAGGYGTMVEIDHGHGLTTRYAHLESILVDAGHRVAKGDAVGLVGATGRATGPHLHYETRIDGEPVDPARFLDAGRRLADAGEAR